MYHTYERYNEDGQIVHCPMHDLDRKITGRYVIGVREWFDENPEERKRLGWIKHIHYNYDEAREKWPYNPQTQFLIAGIKQIDDYTIEDEYFVADKSEEMLWFEEMAQTLGLSVVNGSVINDGNGGIIYGA